MTPDARPTPACARRARGFTIVELMIAVLVLGVIAALAMPSFFGALAKGRRADAMSALTAISQAQERYRTNNAAYAGAVTDLGGVGAQSSAGHYAVAVVGGAGGPSPTAYVATAVANAASPQFTDLKCRTFVLAVDGLAVSYSSKDASGQVNPAPDPCWVR